VARHEDLEWSDVDLLIILQKRVGYAVEREIIFDIYSLIDTVDMIVSPHFQAEAAFQARSRVPNSIEATILENGILLAENTSIKRKGHKIGKVDA
jgi:predicted nucleotidyltransferase